MEQLPTRFMIKPAPWAIEALANQVEKNPTMEWRDVANFLFEEGCRALGYGGDEETAVSLLDHAVTCALNYGGYACTCKEADNASAE